MSEDFPGFSLPLEQAIARDERRQSLVSDYTQAELSGDHDASHWDDERNMYLIDTLIDLMRDPDQHLFATRVKAELHAFIVKAALCHAETIITDGERKVNQLADHGRRNGGVNEHGV